MENRPGISRRDLLRKAAVAAGLFATAEIVACAPIPKPTPRKDVIRLGDSEVSQHTRYIVRIERQNQRSNGSNIDAIRAIENSCGKINSIALETHRDHILLIVTDIENCVSRLR